MRSYAHENLRDVFLKNITFRNFRNYEVLNLQFSESINLITGGNAQGKTNILEGIYFLSTAKSHRTNLSDELIQHEKRWFYLKGEVSSKNSSTTVEIINAYGEGKRARIDGKPQERISNIIGKINTVMFSPEDLSLVKGSPSERRRFLDIIISRINPSYLHALFSYRSALRQRNELLRKVRDARSGESRGVSRTVVPIAFIDSLDSWNILLVKAGAEVIEQRVSVVSQLADLAMEKHKQLTSSKETLRIEYQSQLKAINRADICEAFEKSLADVIDLDIRRGSTSVGPHRDDLLFTIDHMDIRKFCSQGQQRTGVLSLKLADMELMNLRLGEYPIVLLDDVTSELDAHRASFFFDLLNKLPVQAFLSATDFHRGDSCFPSKETYHFHVANGLCARVYQPPASPLQEEVS